MPDFFQKSDIKHLVHQIMIWKQVTKGDIMVEDRHRSHDQDKKGDKVFFKQLKKVSRSCPGSYRRL